MPVKMIAVGRYYDRDAAKEYKTGQHFVVANDKIADRLERACRAKRDVAKPAPSPVAKPTIAAKVMVAEAQPPVVPETPKVESTTPLAFTSPESGETMVPLTPPTTRSSRYRRNDLRSED